jgi:hypothetical protein
MSKQLKFVEQAEGNSGSVVYIKAKELAEKGFTGVVATGVYTGTTPNQFNADRPNIVIEETDMAATPTGRKLIINAAGNLNYRMSNKSVGDIVQVSYLGQEKIKSPDKTKNGKLVHQFNVVSASE